MAEDGVIPDSWLTSRVDLAEAEAAGEVDGVAWESLRAALKPGDEIWLYGSPLGGWKNMAGRQGVAVVRDGRVITDFPTIMT